MKLYFVAGEASGDTHGAALIAELSRSQPDLDFLGRGGPRMKSIAAPAFIDWSEKSAVMGLWEVLKQYGYFRREFAATLQEIAAHRPDAVVLIDYPGFNLRLARALREQTPALKIIYYISPQVWAWNRRRIPQMARYLDLMICIFPFEAELYNKSRLRTVFVGHPMLETLSARRINIGRDPNLVGLFPGSRRREIRKILPVMIRAAERIAENKANVRFEIAGASSLLTAEIQSVLRSSRLASHAVQVSVGEAAATMQRAQVGIVASGTATLEAAFFRLPFVLVYRMAWLTYFAARLVVKVKYVGMPNVLAGKQIVPEFIQHRADPRAIAEAALQLLDGGRRSHMISEFDQIMETLGGAGASTSAAQAILGELGYLKTL